MFDHHTRTRNWLSDLANINADIERNGLPSPAGRAKRARKLKPLWEE
jgi:hypothetical protein